MNAHVSRSMPGAFWHPSDPTQAIQSFFRRHETVLASAVDAVAGPMEARWVGALAGRLLEASNVTDADLADLVRLHRLLSLDLEVEDPRWMRLHPNSKIVLRVCRMTDAVAGLLRECDADRASAESIARLYPPSDQSADAA